MTSRRLSLALVAIAALSQPRFNRPSAKRRKARPAVRPPLQHLRQLLSPRSCRSPASLTEPDGKPVSGETAVTFLVFKNQTGGEPLFAETQAVNPDANGHYKSSSARPWQMGLPVDLFATGEARWLEVQAAGQAPQPRVLMASVPYALKAADSATLGGLPGLGLRPGRKQSRC